MGWTKRGLALGVLAAALLPLAAAEAGGPAERPLLLAQANAIPVPRPPAPAVPVSSPDCPGGVMAFVGRPASRRCLRPGDVFRDCPDFCPEMVVVPAGSFVMGSAADEPDREADEEPAHRVAFAAPFAVGRLEVTRGQFAAYLGDSGIAPGEACWVVDRSRGETAPTNVFGRSFRDPGFPQELTHPAVCLSFDEAKEYADWLAGRAGQPYRLLSEAEWEYANRAGSTTRFPFGAEAGQRCGFANSFDRAPADAAPAGAPPAAAPAGATPPAAAPAGATPPAAAPAGAACADGHAATAPGGSLAANAFGLYDMAGNVWEWTEDCYVSSYGGAPADGKAVVVTGCDDRVLRGGSWLNDEQFLRSAFRLFAARDFREHSTGFRVARALVP